MRKLILAALIAFILIVPFASAKNIVYVTRADTYTPCSNLTTEDKFFCERLESLGYGVQVINEEHIKSATDTWINFLAASDMIFIGDISFDMVNTSRDQGQFCGNISIASKPVFASFAATLKNTTQKLEGCAFSGLVSFAFGDNRFERDTFRIEKIGYITRGYNLSQTVKLYTIPVIVKIHNIADSGWLTAECTPDTIGFYPIINTSSTGVFWGLDKPSQFTSDAWNLFDRTVVFALGEKMWEISAITIPENITKNQTFWLLAKILKRDGTEINKTGTVNISSGGNLLFNSGTAYWENRTMLIQADKILSIEADDGNLTTLLKAGNITVNILSGNYFPGTNYTILASSSQLAILSYKIRNSSNLTILSTGNLEKTSNTYNKTITTGGWGNFILEINAANGTLSGGTFGIINTTFVQEINLATDKLQYKPGEVVKVNLSSNVDITQANLTIIFPDNTSLDLGPMNKISSLYFNKSYSLLLSAPQGNYILSAKIKTDSEILERNTTIEVIVFKISSSLDKTTYRAGDSAKLMLQVLDLYNTPLNVSYKVNLSAPTGTEEQVDLGVTGLDGYAEVFHAIRTDYLTGGYKFKIWVWDSSHNESRVFVEKSFNIIAAGTLSVLPASWSLTEVGSYTKEFFINNTGSGNLTDITVALSQSLQGLVTLNTAALLIRVGPYGNTSFFASINAQQNVNGTITVSYAEGTFPIQVSVILQPIEGVLEIFPTSWSIITIAGEKPQKEFSLRPNIDADRINVTTDLDIIQVIGYPSSIKAGEDGILTLEADTTGLEEGTKTGKVDISSSIGSAELTVRIEILGDITSEVDHKKLELAELEKNITALKKTGRNATELLSVYQEIISLLDSAKASFEEKDYAQAKSKFSDAQSKISTLETKLNQAWAIPLPGIGSAIWTVAKIIIIIIILVTAFIYRDKIKEFINKILKKKPPERKEEHYPEYKEEKERYRTGYY